VPATVGGDPRWLLGPYGKGLRLDGLDFLAFLVVAFLGYLCVVANAGLLPRRVLWGAIGTAIALFALAPPLLSQDVFSYISYARLGVDHGLNPYVAVPAAVPGDPALPFVGWRHVTSAYGPLFTIASYPAGLLSVPEALWLFKLLAAGSVLGLTALVARLAARLGTDPARAAALVGLNPLVLVDVVGGAHNDGTMMLVVIGSLALVLSRKEVASGAAVVAGAGLKASAAVAVPFALLGSRRPCVIAGTVAGLAATAALALGAFGVGSLDSIALVGQDQAATSKYSVPATAARLLDVGVDPVRYTALALYLLVLLLLAVWTLRSGEWIRAAGWAALGLLLATGWLMPWYVIWVLPLSAIVKDNPLRAGTLGLCAFQLINRIPL
jgi:alpha-1,6-mannosyltransferase